MSVLEGSLGFGILLPCVVLFAVVPAHNEQCTSPINLAFASRSSACVIVSRQSVFLVGMKVCFARETYDHGNFDSGVRLRCNAVLQSQSACGSFLCENSRVFRRLCVRVVAKLLLRISGCKCVRGPIDLN